MATGVGLRQILLPQLNWPTPKTNCLVQELRTYLMCRPSYSQFCVQITEVGYHGNKGQSGVNLNDTIRSADTENPSLVQTACMYLQRCPSYHRLNGSSSPVLTATCLSYGRLCDFLTFFSSTDLQVTPLDRF